MKKFLAFLMAALMLLSFAVAEGTDPAPETEAPVPSSTPEVDFVYEPAVEPEIEGEVTVTPELFAMDNDPEAVAMAEQVLAQIESDDIDYPVQAFQSETQTAALAALGVEAEDVTVLVAPIPMLVNDEVAQTVNGDQLLVLSNVPVLSDFVIVLSVMTGDEYEEILLDEVDSDPASQQIYAKVDKNTLEKLRKADVVIATVLTVRQQN